MQQNNVLKKNEEEVVYDGELPMKASDLFVQCLEEEGIEYIFGVPGEENADFMMSWRSPTRSDLS